MTLDKIEIVRVGNFEKDYKIRRSQKLKPQRAECERSTFKVVLSGQKNKDLLAK